MGKSLIEVLVQKANSEPGSPGYHVAAAFADGSYINAPISRFGCDWALFTELNDEELFVDLTGAVLSIDWMPGAAIAEGKRFEKIVNINSSQSGPRL